jgi:hypothetical protein
MEKECAELENGRHTAGAIGRSKAKLADGGNPIRPARIGLGGPRPGRTASLPDREVRRPRD